MKTKYFLTLLLLLLLFSGCAQMTIDDSAAVQSNAIQDLRIVPGDTPITSDEAINVALMFMMRKSPTTKVSSSKITGVQTINNMKGQPVMYAVCFEKNKGFVIISASRKYQPVLAEEEKHTFTDHRQSTGFDIWVQEQTVLINIAESLPETDETVRRYREEWKDYERLPISSIATKDDNLLTLRANAIATWEAQGYTCFDLGDCPNSLPQSVYENWLDLAEQVANPDYNYLTNSIILYMREDTTVQHGPYLTTIWGQDAPYNAYLPLINGLRPRAGCAIVAMGQIMRKHEWPNCYYWSSMGDYYTDEDTAPDVATLFYDLGAAAQTNYGVGGSSTNPNNLVSAITNNHFNYSATLVSHSYSSAKSEVIAERPVYMQGIDVISNTPHAWVCDGVKTYWTHRNYILKVLSSDEPLSYVTAGTPYNSYETSEYLHMNWGEDGAANGWFYQDSVHFAGQVYFEWIEFNMSANRSDIIGITPNQN